MTNNGPATQNNFQAITLPGEYYDANITNTGNLFTITAINSDRPNLNVLACINLNNGASALA